MAWRRPVYIVAGFAGIVGMALLLLQPMLAASMLPGLGGSRGRRLHRLVGAGLLLAVIIHVAGLWITSPPDVIDALLFTSPTPFSVWGVIAMWALFVTTCVAVFRRKLPGWRGIHRNLAIAIMTGSIVHAMLIEGTMGPTSKAMLCAAVFLATFIGIFWSRRARRSWLRR
ncbi:ferric reductase-like transmembrane domain-containing protein [Paracoccus sp. R12_1]|nr:ferric reductase-like transmembrane domain-containing protein [Paracoccus sp. R12_2]MBO9485057.1 ferric reductase-like transmembrane domain-containing protein [Paracoccus sp. R12_1]